MWSRSIGGGIMPISLVLAFGVMEAFDLECSWSFLSKLFIEDGDSSCSSGTIVPESGIQFILRISPFFYLPVFSSGFPSPVLLNLFLSSIFTNRLFLSLKSTLVEFVSSSSK